MKHVKELAEIIVEQGRMIEDLEQDYSLACKQRDEHRRNEAERGIQLSEAQQLVKRLQESNSALAADNNRRQEREQSLASDNESLRQFNTELTNRFQALQQGNVDLSNKVAELETENAVLADREAVLQLQNNDLRDEIKAHVITADNLRDRISNTIAFLSLPESPVATPLSEYNAQIIDMLQPKAQQ